MTDERQGNKEQSQSESPRSVPGEWFWGVDWVCNFLLKTNPAMLLVWSAGAIIGAAVLTFIGVRIMMNSNNDSQALTIYINEPEFLSTGLFAIPAFLLGVVGTLLPMWAVGRLIADAIKEGARS